MTKINILFFIIILIVVSSIWYYYPSISLYVFGVISSPERQGLLGDSYGALNTLFSAFAFTGLIASLYLQNHQIKSTKDELTKQETQQKIDKFENNIFNLLSLHRANVEEIKYKRKFGDIETIYEKRHVFRIMTNEFLDCHKEVKFISESWAYEQIVTQDFDSLLKEIKLKNRIDTNDKELPLINISWMVVYYGIGSEGEQTLKSTLKKHYNEDYLNTVFSYLKLKPYPLGASKFTNMAWNELNKIDSQTVNSMLKNSSGIVSVPTGETKTIQLHNNGIKYYGGHQFRLSHYFRHLYQMYNIIDKFEPATDEEKYNYAKIIRAQLSNYEQVVLFLNSLSLIGYAWEMSGKNSLITKYAIIKNIPDYPLCGISVKNYYKNITYEFEQI